MKKILLVLLSTLAFVPAKAQRPILKFPNKSDWLIELDTVRRFHQEVPSCDCAIYTKQEKIESLADGIVLGVYNIYGTSLVIVKQKECFICYSDLVQINLKKDQAIVKGDYIGLATYNKEKELYSFDITVVKGDGIWELCEKELYTFLSKL